MCSPVHSKEFQSFILVPDIVKPFPLNYYIWCFQQPQILHSDLQPTTDPYFYHIFQRRKHALKLDQVLSYESTIISNEKTVNYWNFWVLAEIKVVI